jgi:hypothetical protein
MNSDQNVSGGKLMDGLAVYIAGPMRGIRSYNFPMFDLAKVKVRESGGRPVSPADIDREAGFDPADLPADWDFDSLPESLNLQTLVRRDLSALQECDAIVLLPGWRKSRGASAELAVAKWLGLKVFHYADLFLSTPEPVTPEPVTPEPPPAGLDSCSPDREPTSADALLPTDAAERKKVPLYSGLLKYFPRALIAVARTSMHGNKQHNPGQPMHWARGKSSDHPDCLMRHLIEGDRVDSDGIPHHWKLAWRALALCEVIEERLSTDEPIHF